MTTFRASAIAHPNIALIKYWGNIDQKLRIPANGSISFNLDSLFTKTTVFFDPSIVSDRLSINHQEEFGPGLDRVVSFLDVVRGLADIKLPASVESENNFPIGTGIASSASAFAALSLSASKALGLELSEQELSRLARRGSGSACRSVPEGFVEWFPGTTNQDSFAASIAQSNHWDLVDIIAVVAEDHKKVGSTKGHKLADTSPLQNARVFDSTRRLNIARTAIMNRDFHSLAQIVEQDSNIMHAVMMTSTPTLFYWESTSITIMKSVQDWRAAGIPVFFTLDAGPNVHIITTSDFTEQIEEKLYSINGIKQIFKARVGGKTRLIEG